jgi:leucyl aminopeptidase (aminopeptidase T)
MNIVHIKKYSELIINSLWQGKGLQTKNRVLINTPIGCTELINELVKLIVQKGAYPYVHYRNSMIDSIIINNSLNEEYLLNFRRCENESLADFCNCYIYIKDSPITDTSDPKFKLNFSLYHSFFTGKYSYKLGSPQFTSIVVYYPNNIDIDTKKLIIKSCYLDYENPSTCSS